MIEYVVTLQLESKDYVFRAPQLMNVSTIKQAINPNKSQENVTAEVTITNINGEMDALMNSSDKFVLGKTMIIERNEIVIFTGLISDFPEYNITEFKLRADTNIIGMNDIINWDIDNIKFPNVPDENKDKYGNIVCGQISDVGATATGMLKARRVDTNTFLAAWHYLNSLIKCYLQDGTDITASCTLVNGIWASGVNSSDADFENWSGGTPGTPDGWYVSGAGGSTCNREGAVVKNGTYSARIDIDASNSNIGMLDAWGLSQNTHYICDFWYRMNLTATTATLDLYIYGRKSASDPWEYLGLLNYYDWIDEYFSSASDGRKILPKTTSWTNVVIKFKTPDYYLDFRILLNRGSACTSQSIYIDWVQIKTAYSYITYTSAVDYILYNAYGYDSSGIIYNPATLLEFINNRFGNFTLNGISDAETIYTARGYSNTAMAIVDGITWGYFLQKFAINFDCFLYFTPGAELKIKALAWGTETATVKLSKSIVSTQTLKKKPDISNLVTQHKILFWYHYEANKYERDYLSNDVNSGWRQTKLEFELEYHRDETEAKDVSERYVFLYKNPLFWFNFTLPEKHANEIEVGDVVEFNHKRAFGYVTDLLVQVFKKEYNYGSGDVGFKVLDVDAINMGIIILWGTGDSRLYELVADGSPGERVLL